MNAYAIDVQDAYGSKTGSDEAFLNEMVNLYGGLDLVPGQDYEGTNTGSPCTLTSYSNDTILERMTQNRNKVRIVGRKVDGKCIGTTLLTKGLEFEDVISIPLQQIFYGAPGTGKSHKIKDDADVKAADEKNFASSTVSSVISTISSGNPSPCYRATQCPGRFCTRPDF